VKTGRTLQELAVEVERQAASKQDYLAPSRLMQVHTATGTTTLELPKVGEFPLNNLAHEQLSAHLNIPRAYYTRLQAEQPALLDTNINTLLGAREGQEQRMVRTLDGNTRAILSDKYRPLDYYDLLSAALPVLGDMGVSLLSCEVTERRLYLKVVDQRIERDVPTGAKMGNGHAFFDTLSPAMILTNSEVGLGMLGIETAVWTRLCTNLAISKERSLRKYHVGARAEFGDGAREMFSDETKRLTDASFWSQVGDVVRGAFERARFDALVDDIQATAERRLTGDPHKAVEAITNKYGLFEEEGSAVLRHFIEGGSLTQYGLYNAVTRASADVADYDRATELERLGGHVITLQPSEWREIAAGEAAKKRPVAE